MRINKAFMGATGVSLTAGMTNTTFLEAEIKRAVVHRADNIYGMVDSSKIGKEAIVTILPPQGPDRLHHRLRTAEGVRRSVQCRKRKAEI